MVYGPFQNALTYKVSPGHYTIAVFISSQNTWALYRLGGRNVMFVDARARVHDLGLMFVYVCA